MNLSIYTKENGFLANLEMNLFPKIKVGLKFKKTDVIKFTLLIKASLVAQTVKSLLARWETWVRSLGQEDLLEKEMATHSSIIAWRIPWMEEPGRLQSMGWQRVEHD